MVVELGGINKNHYRFILIYNIGSLGTLLKGMLGALDTNWFIKVSFGLKKYFHYLSK